MLTTFGRVRQRGRGARGNGRRAAWWRRRSLFGLPNFLSHDLPLLLAVVFLALPGDDLASDVVVFRLHAEQLQMFAGFPPLVVFVESGCPSDLVRDLPTRCSGARAGIVPEVMQNRF